MAYTLRYIDELDDLPITGPDPFSESDKLKAAERAEARLESDVNDGNTLSNPEAIHAQAAEWYATYLLALGPKSPDAVLAGDMADEGTDRTKFSDRLYTQYRDCVDAIRAANADESDDSPDAIFESL